MNIVLEKYNANWEIAFRHEKKNLETLLSPHNVKIEHIGSTSVEGLIAKPIVDILVGLESFESVNSLIELLIKNKYIYYSMYDAKYPERRHLIKIKEEHDLKIIRNSKDDMIDKIGFTRLFHVNLTILNSEFWKRHIAFRDCLRTDSKLKIKYAQLKDKLSKIEWDSMENYSDAKNEFIRKVERITFKKNLKSNLSI